MTFCRPLLPRISRVTLSKVTLIAVPLFALLACGSPQYQNRAIVVTWSTGFPPPASLGTSQTEGIAAVVANDPKNAGVNFTCVPVGECGSFSPDPIASNVPTTYQAPPTVPTGGSVIVTATSVTDATKSVSATITIE
ncbi:MAG: hypothetical protein ABSB87_10965 [Terriglobales bacterium]|jgi:hypothetical protein